MLACLPSLFSACSIIYDDYPIENDAPANKTAMIVLSVATPAATSRAAQDIEMMHSLRVVLLDNNGIVEYNTLENDSNIFGSGISELDYATKIRLIPTTPGVKKIFFIANEETVTTLGGSTQQSLTDLLNSYPVGSDGFENAVNNAYFTPDYNNGSKLLLTSSYQITVPESNGHDNIYKHDFWLVHAATKFEFEFNNLRENPITIQNLSISSLANNMFVMAKLDPHEITKTYNQIDYYWIDWLKMVSEDTTNNPNLPDNKNVNDKYGWISGYNMPDGTDHTQTAVNLEPLSDIPSGTKSQPLVVYYPESKSISGDGQEYSLNITVIDTGEGVEEPRKDFENLKLENVKALFRNTHVKVTVTISNKDLETAIELQIGICPWVDEDIYIPPFD